MPKAMMLLLFCVTTAAAADNGVKTPGFSYGKQGMQYEDSSGNNFLWFGVRIQPRWTGSYVVDDELPGAPADDGNDVSMNRARLKLGGHLIRPALAVYSEYDVVGERLLDLRATYRFSDSFSLRVGQWKSEFNRERVDSSGKQQFVERSIVNGFFTIDRQQGIVASGRLGASSRLDTSYWAGWLTGAGRGGAAKDAEGLWLGRLQWNTHGRVLGFSQSAVPRADKPTGSVAIAAVSGRSSFTAFSSNGGGQLPGFDNGAPDQYRLTQFLFETAYHNGGFSWQQELHWKEIDDRATGRTVRLLGVYAQAGMFFSDIIDGFPDPLELALRLASVDPDRGRDGIREREVTLGANWFFNGHRNKLTLDVSRVTRRFAPENDTSDRVRLQWDWSF